MALDTQQKRMSAVGVALPVPSLLPIPDGDIDEIDRQICVWFASVIAAGGYTTLAAPAHRTFVVVAENRAFVVEAENRTFVVEAE